MRESFGTRMRRWREEQHIALATIAEQTKIKQSLLEALERDDISHWPTGIFRKAFIRAYALAINLDGDTVVRDFLELFPEPVEEVSAVALSAAADAARGAAPQGRLRSLLGSFTRRRQPVYEKMVEPEADADLLPDLPPEVPVEPPAAPRPVEDYLPRNLSQFEQALETIAQSARAHVPEQVAESDVDFLSIARICTQFARVADAGEVRPLLHDVVASLNATGLVVWVWDAMVEELRPALASGYSDAMLAHIPSLGRDADNITAVAFRSAQEQSIDGIDRSALVIPLVTPGGCSGVLALELQGNTLTASLRAAATIIAAQLSQLVGGVQPSASVEVEAGDATHSLRTAI